MKTLHAVLCTHQPREEYLKRTLASLCTLQPHSQLQLERIWIVDNASSPAVNLPQEFSGDHRIRLLQESRVGLTLARGTGFQAAKEADWVLLVDDDNVLRSDYLRTAAELIKTHHLIGCFGGSQIPEFEVEPSLKIRPLLPALAIRIIKRASWSNNYDFEAAPFGAGMYVRQEVAETFHAKITDDSRRLALGRSGAKLTGGEDMDLAFTACDLGYASGVFPELQLTHLIPSSRLTLPYLRKLNYSSGYSDIVLRSIRFPEQLSWLAFFRNLLKLLVQPFLPRDSAQSPRQEFRLGQLRALFDLLRAR